MTTDPTSALPPDVQAFIEAVSPAKRPLFDHLQALILEVCPTAEVAISYQVPVFKAPGGRVFLNVWKDGVSLLTTGPEHIAAFRARHPRVKTNKASINLRLDHDVPDDDLQGVIRHALGLEAPAPYPSPSPPAGPPEPSPPM